MSAYIAELNRQLPQPSHPVAIPLNLRQRFVEWYGSLPPFSRNRPFAMSEFEAALGTQGKYISPILLELGWQRKRIWSTAGQYHRYWVCALAQARLQATREME